jgi:hypothetical protein
VWEWKCGTGTHVPISEKLLKVVVVVVVVVVVLLLLFPTVVANRFIFLLAGRICKMAKWQICKYCYF